MGEGLARKLAQEFSSLDALMGAEAEALATVRDVGAIVAASVTDYFARAGNRDVIEKLRRAGVRFDRVEKVAGGGNPDGYFFGKRVVVTGTLEAFTREEAHEALRQRGATVMGTVGKTTQVLIAGASAGSKYAAAQKLGIPILDEAAFIRHLE